MSSENAAVTEDAIKVVVRLRPPIRKEEGSRSVWCSLSNDTVHRTDGKETYTFDRVFDKLSRTEDVYKESVEEVVKLAMTGYNSTVFAYGQTASGKTHTIFGDKHNDGIVQMAVDTIFSTIKSSESRGYLLRMSCVEIYNERVNDLLSDRCDLNVMEMKGNVVVHGVTEEVITERIGVDTLIEDAFERRAVGETNSNEHSSRSHAILRFVIESHDNDCGTGTASYIANLNIVDLAGSENAEQSGTEEVRLREGSNVNRSLFALSRVINQLTTKSSFVSFRDSKLTRLLKTSLGGNSKTLIICTASPVATIETTQALKFASRAKCVKNKPTKNVVTDDALLSKYLRTIEDLRKKLEDNAVAESHERNLEQKNEQLSAEVKKLRSCILSGERQDETVQPVMDQRKLRKVRRQTWGGPHAYRMSLSPTFGGLGLFQRKNVVGSPIEEEGTMCSSSRSSMESAGQQPLLKDCPDHSPSFPLSTVEETNEYATTSQNATYRISNSNNANMSGIPFISSLSDDAFEETALPIQEKERNLMEEEEDMVLMTAQSAQSDISNTQSRALMTEENPLMTAQNPLMTAQNPLMTAENPLMTAQNPLMTAKSSLSNVSNTQSSNVSHVGTQSTNLMTADTVSAQDLTETGGTVSSISVDLATARPNELDDDRSSEAMTGRSGKLEVEEPMDTAVDSKMVQQKGEQIDKVMDRMAKELVQLEDGDINGSTDIMSETAKSWDGDENRKQLLTAEGINSTKDHPMMNNNSGSEPCSTSIRRNHLAEISNTSDIATGVRVSLTGGDVKDHATNEQSENTPYGIEAGQTKIGKVSSEEERASHNSPTWNQCGGDASMKNATKDNQIYPEGGLLETSVIAFSTCQHVTMTDIQEELDEERYTRKMERSGLERTISEQDKHITHLRNILREGKAKYESLKDEKIELEERVKMLQDQNTVWARLCDEADDMESELRQETNALDTKNKKILDEVESLRKMVADLEQQTQSRNTLAIAESAELLRLRDDRKEYDNTMASMQREVLLRDKKIRALQMELRRVSNAQNPEQVSMSPARENGAGPSGVEGDQTPTPSRCMANPGNVPPSAPSKQKLPSSPCNGATHPSHQVHSSPTETEHVPGCNQQ